MYRGIFEEGTRKDIDECGFGCNIVVYGDVALGNDEKSRDGGRVLAVVEDDVGA